jgi:hypothetical protein
VKVPTPEELDTIKDIVSDGSIQDPTAGIVSVPIDTPTVPQKPPAIKLPKAAPKAEKAPVSEPPITPAKSEPKLTDDELNDLLNS